MPGLAGSSRAETVSRGAEILINPPDHPAAIFKSKAVVGEKHDGRLRPTFICAGCGDELVLTSSGHQFCANRWCKEGFDVRPDWRMTVLIELLTEEAKESIH